MPCSHILEAPSTISSVARMSSLETGRPGQTSLWSNLQDLCKLLQIAAPSSVDKEGVFQHIQFRPGQRVHARGQAFDTLYILNSGFIKTRLFNEEGSEQVLSFPMRGDILGIDGIITGHHVSDAIALTDCDLILVPYRRLTALGRVHSDLETVMCGAMSRELARERARNRMLRALGAEARVARFLMLLSDRFAGMGYSNKHFNLRMTRLEIGSYLGIAIETVTRTFSSLNKLGLITLEKRTIVINDPETLMTLRRLPRTRKRIPQGRDAMQRFARGRHPDAAVFDES